MGVENEAEAFQRSFVQLWKIGPQMAEKPSKQTIRSTILELAFTVELSSFTDTKHSLG